MMTMPLRYAFILILALFLSGCGLAVTPPPFIPTNVPPTPISTHLPSVATDIPAGFDSNNPIRLVIVGNDDNAAEALAEQMNTLSEIEVEVVLVDTQAEALRMLCASDTGAVSAAWVDGKAYAAARQCGIVSLQAERGRGRVSNTGEAGVLVMNAEFAEAGLSAALEENFCRVSVNDFYGWLVPQMLFAIEEVDPATIADVNEYPDNDALVAALVSGECAAIGMAESQWEEYLDADTTLADKVSLVSTSAPFPHMLMVFPFAADLQVINELSAILLQLDMASGRSGLEAEETEGTPESTSEAEATAAPEGTAAPEISMEESDMASLFGEGYFLPIENSDFSILDGFLESTGLNFAEIGH